MEIGRGLIAPLILALILMLTLTGTLQASRVIPDSQIPSAGDGYGLPLIH